MFYQEALLKFCVSIACLQVERDTGEELLRSKKPNQQTHFCLWHLFMWGAYFCMGAYKPDVVVVVKIGAYIHGCLFCVSAYYPDFMVSMLYGLKVLNCLCNICGSPM